MNPKAHGLITITNNTNIRDFSQGIFRMRDILKGQTCDIIFNDIFNDIIMTGGGCSNFKRIRMNSKSPIERWGPESGVWVWKYPLNERKYVISADISRGDSNDYSAFHVIDTQESEQVCEFKGKLPPDQFGILLNEVGTRYNKALICPENNTYGFSTIQKLRDLGYPNLHLNDKRYQYAVEIPTSKFGFATSGPSRNAVLTKLEEYLRTGTNPEEKIKFLENN